MTNWIQPDWVFQSHGQGTVKSVYLHNNICCPLVAKCIEIMISRQSFVSSYLQNIRGVRSTDKETENSLFYVHMVFALPIGFFYFLKKYKIHQKLN